MDSRLGVTATADIDVLPGIVECSTQRGTVQLRPGSNPAVAREGRPVARPPRLGACDGGQVRSCSRSGDSHS
ncbi:MAG: hypothetical protein P8017_10600 [Deltaproteobacteria bacterium]|jgi:hypothetical protein